MRGPRGWRGREACRVPGACGGRGACGDARPRELEFRSSSQLQPHRRLDGAWSTGVREAGASRKRGDTITHAAPEGVTQTPWHWTWAGAHCLVPWLAGQWVGLRHCPRCARPWASPRTLLLPDTRALFLGTAVKVRVRPLSPENPSKAAWGPAGASPGRRVSRTGGPSAPQPSELRARRCRLRAPHAPRRVPAGDPRSV